MKSRGKNTYTGTIVCQICDSKTQFQFRKPSYFVPVVSNIECSGCESKFMVHVLKPKGAMKDQFEFVPDFNDPGDGSSLSDKGRKLWEEKQARKANDAAATPR